MDNIAILDIEAVGRNRYNFKYWRGEGPKAIQKPDTRESSFYLNRKDFFCSQISKEIKTANSILPESLDVDSQEKLISAGQVLYHQLLPSSIQRKLKNLEYPLLISTNDPSIPWELLHDGDDFLALKYTISRDLHKTVSQTHGITNVSKSFPTDTGKISFLFVVNPYDPEEILTNTSEECEDIMESLDFEKVEATYLSDDHATLWAIEKCLTQSYNVIHYAGHVFYDLQKKKSYIPLPEGEKLFPTDIGFISGNPLVFLNGCESDIKKTSKKQSEFYVNNISLAQSFLLKGAKAVVGSIAKVQSLQAGYFAVSFYKHLLAGETIGESMRLARIATRENFPNDATFLSFLLYGHPGTTLFKTPSPEDFPFFLEDGSLNESHFSSDALTLLKGAISHAENMGSKKVGADHLLLSLVSPKQHS